jgi:1-hydroxy-2-naphthoate dioxygenase
MIDYSAALKDFDLELAQLHMRGQWLPEPARRPEAAPPVLGNRVEPRTSGVPYLWKWSEVEPKLYAACQALPESFTARRALAFKNPELPRCAAQTLGMAIQAIRPHEIAWAHRHTIAALRFVIKGHPDLVTVVDGVAYRMAENDLVLTPSWTFHDHRNDSDEVVYWLDVLDVPFVGGLNMGFYEELGAVTQPITAYGDDPAAPGNCGYTWRETEPKLRALDGTTSTPYDGITLDYPDRATGGPTLPTLGCTLAKLPPGFAGRGHRHTSSTVYHVVAGEGTTEAGGVTMHWSARDSFVVPNWTLHRHANRSQTEEALLFAVTDAPALRALGYYREEAERGEA